MASLNYILILLYSIGVFLLLAFSGGNVNVFTYFGLLILLAGIVTFWKKSRKLEDPALIILIAQLAGIATYLMQLCGPLA
ncbi:hypothetical protein SAMN02745181_3810 [Rubritalea squalenifaciens DSM 18772]|uniref:Uncharacterized protein n=1 Tax=Rubritalea squalenifaciens DSM 18772 TaxID=1123071 RepID=A0A1M6SF53_9BACT|nr:hypothetical protein [Rubritalea squalenifaciens]SHK43351.1 hypothetical protein SAMN02745181_3810 [Rubritalea squalenifaciens DSM 18772]